MMNDDDVAADDTDNDDDNYDKNQQQRGSTCFRHVVTARACGRTVSTTEHCHTVEAAGLRHIHSQPRRPISWVAARVRTAPLSHVPGLDILLAAQKTVCV